MCIWYKSIQTLVEEIACDENTATFRFTIRDTGIGMSEDFVNNELFEPFTQEKQGARTQYQGTGLGMSIVKELIAMTANAFSEDVERSRKAGMTEHLSKPLNAETLKKRSYGTYNPCGKDKYSLRAAKSCPFFVYRYLIFLFVVVYSFGSIRINSKTGKRGV